MQRKLGSEKDVILKYWASKEVVAVIKEVATKGEYVDTCIEYVSRRLQISLEDSKKFFHENVDAYVQRILTEKLIHKAEDILKNVYRDVESYFFQFAFECKEDNLKSLILERLQKRNPINFETNYEENKFYWEILETIKHNSKLFHVTEIELNGKLRLENLFKRDEAYRKALIVKVYFLHLNRNYDEIDESFKMKEDDYLNRIDKTILWDYFINEDLHHEIIKWCLTQLDFPEISNFLNGTTMESMKLNARYKQWTLDKDMLSYAIQNIQNPSEIIRNCFAGFHFFFEDESNDVQRILYRLSTIENINNEKYIFKSILIVKYLIETELYELLLEDFIQSKDMEMQRNLYPGKETELDLVLCLKNESYLNKTSINNISTLIYKILKKKNSSLKCDKNPLIALMETLLNTDKYDFNGSNDIDVSLRKLPYIRSFLKRCNLEEVKPKTSPQKMLKKFKGIDLNEILSKEGGSEKVLSFSNKYLCQKYSQPFKLNYVHYIKQTRSSFALYQFLIEQLTGYSQISQSQFFTSAETVIDLAISQYRNDDILVHCIAFIEMLGFNTQNLRSIIRLLRIIWPFVNKDILNENCGNFTKMRMLNNIELVEMAERKLTSIELTSISTDDSNEYSYSIRNFNALMNVFKCSSNKNKFPEKLFRISCKENNWWNALIILQYFDLSINQVKIITKTFQNPIIGNHLFRALSHEVNLEKNKRRQSVSRPKSHPRKTSIPNAPSHETITSSLSSNNEPVSQFSKFCQQSKFLQEKEDSDLFALILLSWNPIVNDEKITNYAKYLEIMQDQNGQNTLSTSLNLMVNTKVYEKPILAILAVTVSDLNLNWCWVTWLTTSMSQFKIIYQFKHFNELMLNIIENCVKEGFIRTLNRSFQIFFQDNKFCHFTRFLQQTIDFNFTNSTLNSIKLYLLSWSNDEISLPMVEENNCQDKYRLINFTIKLLIIHLKYNFQSKYYQQLLLNLICQSGISDISHAIDFCLLRNVLEIISDAQIEIDYEKLCILESDDEGIVNEEYRRMINSLQCIKEYNKAIALAYLLNFPISDYVYSKWINSIENGDFNIDFQCYEQETKNYSLAPEFLVNFFLYTAVQIYEPTIKKYLLFKKALDVVKTNRLFPNECIDRDQIEYEMILCFLQNEETTVKDLEIYHSEYFEEILIHERRVLYKSFPELKELAGIDDLTTNLRVKLTERQKLKFGCLLNYLLDEGDIVEALRLQAMFEYRTIDLQFIVSCMALAEGLLNLYDLGSDERQLLSEIERSSITKFNKLTLGRVDTSDFEEIPSREKQDVLQALQGLVSRLNYGVELGKRIIMVYRAAMYLDKDYVDVLRMKDTIELLKNATKEECLQKLVVIQDIFTSNQMNQVEVAEYLGYEIAKAIIRPRFYIFRTGRQSSQSNLSLYAQNELWGYDLDKQFHLILELCPSTTVLGNILLNYCDALKIYRKYQDNKNEYKDDVEKNPNVGTAFEHLKEIIRIYGNPSIDGQGNSSTATATTSAMSSNHQVLSHKKQNTISVELLIKAFQCFVNECSMEGIANILNRAKFLTTNLAAAKSWNLIVRMLTGIGKYREMYYCFDTLISNEQFESLLLLQWDEDKTNGLKNAIISYLQEHCPGNKEFLQMAAMHFLMHKELAEMKKQEANSVMAKVLSENQISSENPNSTKMYDERMLSISLLKCNLPALTSFNKILDNLTLATEYYLLDNKLKLAQKSASHAELIAMQIDLMNKGLNSSPTQTCICVVNIRSSKELRDIINTELSMPQALILSRVYSYEVNWPEAILSQYILLGRSDYLKDFQNFMPLTDTIIENIVKSFQLQSLVLPEMEESMENLIQLIQSVSLRYKLASLLGFKNIITALINSEALYYLKDTNYGRNENNI